MIQNARLTAFTVSELLMGSPTQSNFRVKRRNHIHNVHPPPFSGGGRGWGVKPLTKFSRMGGGLDRTLIIRRGLVRKRGLTFLRRRGEGGGREGVAIFT